MGSRGAAVGFRYEALDEEVEQQVGIVLVVLGPLRQSCLLSCYLLPMTHVNASICVLDASAAGLVLPAHLQFMLEAPR